MRHATCGIPSPLVQNCIQIGSAPEEPLGEFNQSFWKISTLWSTQHLHVLQWKYKFARSRERASAFSSVSFHPHQKESQQVALDTRRRSPSLDSIWTLETYTHKKGWCALRSRRVECRVRASDTKAAPAFLVLSTSNFFTTRKRHLPLTTWLMNGGC